MSKFISRFLAVALGCFSIVGLSSSALAKHEVVLGPERTVINDFEVDDYNNCTDEIVRWKGVLTSFDFVHISGNGDNRKQHVVSHFQWTATVTGLTTGYVWDSMGGGKDTVKFDPADGVPFKEIFIENSVLQPVTPGAPRIQFHALIRVRLDELGNTVVESVDYEYTCIGRNK